MHLSQELLMNVQPRSFTKETSTLKIRSTVSGHQKLTMTNWEDHWSWSSYTYRRRCPRTSTVLCLFGIWSKLERWESLISGCLMNWPKIFLKNCHFEELSSLILYNNNKPFLDWITVCDKMWILYNNQRWPAQWLDQEAAPKHLPKPNLH